MKKLLLLVTMLTMVMAATIPAVATSYAYGSCADIPTYAEAQQILDDPNYGYDPAFPPQGSPVDIFNLDPDGDGVACNDEGNLTGDAQGFVLPVPFDDCGGQGECSLYPAETFEVPTRYRVDCHPVASVGGLCAVDDYGLALLPADGAKAPVEEVSEGPVLDLYTGNLVRFVEGEPVVVEWAQNLPLPGPGDPPVYSVSELQYGDTAG